MHTSMLVSAAAEVLAAVPGPQVSAVKSLPEVISSLQAWIIGIAAAVASLFAAIGAVRYMTAGGDTAQMEQAKGNFRAAFGGYALAILAPVILQILQGILGV